MSLSDLELLQLVDTVKAKQRGPKGEPGVGITEIDQFDETGFTLRLSDGSFKRINLPTPKDGAVGPVGPAGPVGETGSPGRAGRDGVQGPAGRDGQDGLPGSSLETAVVNSNGHLLLGISDGSIIDVGRVVGPAGATGAVGATGLAGESGKDGAAVLSGPRAPSQDDGVEGDHWIDISSAEFSFFKKDGDGWTKLANLRQPARDPRVGPVAGGGGSGGGAGEPAAGYTTSNLPLTGLGRSADGKAEPPPGGISKPGGNIIPEAKSLKYQSNMNRWAVESLDALDDALPIGKVDTLPDKGKYEGDMVLFEGALWIWSGGDWIEVGGAVDVSDYALKSSVQRVEDNLDLIQDTVGAGRYARVAKPLTPVGPGEGEACFLQDGGAEATTFAEVENIQLNKTGIGPYADFSSAKKGDYLLLQSAVDGDFGLYVIRNATEFGTFWDFGLEISANKVVGTVPEIGEGIIVRTSRPTFTVAQDTPPDFSASGQLWFDTAEHQLKVWDEDAQEFVETGGGGASTHVGENPPEDAAEGDLWYDSTRLELFVYYVDPDNTGGWVPCSPLGARVEAGEILQQQILQRVEDGEAKQAEIEADYLKKSGGEVTGRLDVTGSYFTVDSYSKFKRTDASAASNYVVSVEAPLLDEGAQVAFRVNADGSVKAGHSNALPFMAAAKNDVITKAYADDHLLQTDKVNDVTTGFRIKADGSTLISSSGNELGLYHLKDPKDGNPEWAATKGYVDEQIAAIEIPDGGGGVTGDYLPLSGGTLTGDVTLSGGELYVQNGHTTSWWDQSNKWAIEFRAKGTSSPEFTMQGAQGVKIDLIGRSTNGSVDIPGVSFDPRLMQWSFRNIKEPGSDSDAATKKYVDEKVVSANQIWAPSKFKYRSDGNNTNLNPGEFFIGSSDGQRTITLHHSCADGVDWTFHEASVNWTQTFNGPCGIRGIDGTIFFQADTVSMQCYGQPTDARHVIVRTQNSRRPGNMTNGEEYVIYIPGILPRLILS